MYTNDVTRKHREIGDIHVEEIGEYRVHVYDPQEDFTGDLVVQFYIVDRRTGAEALDLSASEIGRLQRITFDRMISDWECEREYELEAWQD